MVEATVGALTARRVDGSRTDRVEQDVEAGSTWIAKQDVPGYEARDHVRPGVPADMLLIVREVRNVDGHVHTIVLAPHPSEPADRFRRFRTDDFFGSFVEIGAAEAEAARAAEIADVTSRLAAAQNDLLVGPPQNLRLPAPPRMPTDLSTMVAVAPQASAVDQRMSEVMETAERQRLWIAERTTAISRDATLLSRFYSERGDLAVARISDVLESAARLKRGAKSLSLYTGEGVEVWKVSTGPGAQSTEPLTVYQRRLFLDEETAVEFGMEGIDAETLEDLPAALARTPSLLDRIAPAPRSVVLMRLRRETTASRASDLAQFFRAIEFAELERQSFLFIRDGGNAYIVRSDLVWSFDGASDDFDRNGLIRLFPSVGDLDKPFRGAEGRTINLSDLDFTDAKRRFDDRALAYKRLLVLLWGLNDREGIFGDFPGGQADWSALDWQERNIRFVRDDEMGLEHSRPGWREFLADRSRFLQVGSRVWVSWPSLVDPDIAPMLYRKAELDRIRDSDRETRGYTEWRAAERPGVAMVVRNKGRPALRFTVTSRSARKVVHVDLENVGGGSSLVVCLDGMTAQDIRWYVDNRRDRQDYAWFLRTFTSIHRLLVEDEARQAPAVGDALRQLVESGAEEGEAVKAAVWEAARLWRAGNGGSDLPTPGSKQHAAFLSLVWIVSGRDVDFDTVLEDYQARTGAVALRLVIDTSGDYIIYEETASADRIDVMGGHVWVSRRQVSRTRSGLVATGEPRMVRMQDMVPDELTLAERPAAQDWIGFANYEGKTSFEHLRAVHDDVAGVSVDIVRALTTGRGGAPDYKALRQRMTSVQKGYVQRRSDFVPVGIAVRAHRARYSLSPTTPEPMVLALSYDPLKARASGGHLVEVERFVESVYGSPESHVEALRKIASVGFRPSLVWLPLESWQVGGRVADIGESGLSESKGGWRGSVFEAARLEIPSADKRHWNRSRVPIEQLIRYVTPAISEYLDELFPPSDEPKPDA